MFRKWARAVVLNSAVNGVIVKFIDYGNMDILEAIDVIPANKQLSYEVCVREFIVDSKFNLLNLLNFNFKNYCF